MTKTMPEVSQMPAYKKKTPDKQVRNRGVSTRWKSGQSGNPKGRPPKRECLTSLLKEAMDSTCPEDKQNRTWAEVITERLLAMAVKGDLQAMKLIFEYVAGKPTQIEESPKDVVIRVVYDD